MRYTLPKIKAMTITDLASFIRANKPGLNYPGVHPADDESVVLQYTRHEMLDYVHITNEHIKVCCEQARTYEEHIELCKPLAKADTENFRLEQLKPASKGRTKRRFK